MGRRDEKWHDCRNENNELLRALILIVALRCAWEEDKREASVRQV